MFIQRWGTLHRLYPDFNRLLKRKTLQGFFLLRENVFSSWTDQNNYCYYRKQQYYLQISVYSLQYNFLWLTLTLYLFVSCLTLLTSWLITLANSINIKNAPTEELRVLAEPALQLALEFGTGRFHLCSTVRAVSGLPDAPFNHLSARYYLVLWKCAGLCSFLHVSKDLLSRFYSQPFKRASACTPQARSFSFLRHHCSRNAAEAFLLPLHRCSDQFVVTLVGKLGFHLIILPTSGHEAKTRRTPITPQGGRT